MSTYIPELTSSAIRTVAVRVEVSLFCDFARKVSVSPWALPFFDGAVASSHDGSEETTAQGPEA